MPAPFTLQFPAVDLPALASRYTDPGDPRMDDIGNAARQRGHLTRDELLELVAWKSGGRQLHNARKNTPASVEEITAVALTAADERLRIGALLCLDGVSWPTASAILHFAHAEAYPLLDQRALQALGVKRDPANYNLAFWLAYVDACRQLAATHSLSMRTLDRALWQWSKERGVPLTT